MILGETLELFICGNLTASIVLKVLMHPRLTEGASAPAKGTACYTRPPFLRAVTCHGLNNEGRSGETGRRAGFKIPWGSLPVWVRVPPPAPHSSTAPAVLIGESRPLERTHQSEVSYNVVLCRTS